MALKQCFRLLLVNLWIPRFCEDGAEGASDGFSGKADRVF